MLYHGQNCSLCGSETASHGCICSSSLSLIGSNCLLTHIQDCLFTHYFLDLAFTSQLSVYPSRLQSYLAPSPNAGAQTNSQFFSLSSASNLAVQPLHGRSLQADLEISIGRDFTTDKLLCYFNSPDQLLIYDVISKSLESVALEDDSYDKNMFLLPNGDIYIMCEGDLKELDTLDSFIYNISTRRLSKLPYYTVFRTHIAFCYHQGYLYAFGGTNDRKDFKIAERFNLLKNTREQLPNMKYARSDLSCVMIGDEICLFHGSSKSIEVLDTIHLEYREMWIENVEANYSSGIAHRVGDKVYLLTYNYIQIYDNSLTKIQEIYHNSQLDQFSSYRITTYKDDIYYFNYPTGTVHKLNLALAQNQISSDPSSSRKYVYTSNECIGLLRIDLELKTASKVYLCGKQTQADSLCVLPNGELLIIQKGRKESVLYSPEMDVEKAVCRMPYICSGIRAIYHKENIYGFGCKKAKDRDLEGRRGLVFKFDLDNKSWYTVLEFKILKKWSRISCVGIENRIYIIDDKGSIYEYDIEKNCCSATAVKLYCKGAIGKAVEDRIYILHDNRYKIYSKELDLLEEGLCKWPKHMMKTASSVEIYEGKIYFFNDETGLLEYHDTLNNTRKAEAVQYL